VQTGYNVKQQRKWTFQAVLKLGSGAKPPEADSFLANVNVRYMLSPICLSSVTLVRPTQAVQNFGNISTAFGTLAIH